MARRAANDSHFTAPFLRSIALREDKRGDGYPFSVPLFEPGFALNFTHPVTIIMGTNGSGKSTLLEAIAGLCGFAQLGGSRNHAVSSNDSRHALANAFRPSWKPKVSDGFFVRAETLYKFIDSLNDIAETSGQHGATYAAYGGQLEQRSHGEAFLQLFEHQLQRRGVFILDEPEAALSPARQLDFMRLLQKSESVGQAQFIIATHSPLLMAYPGATLLEIESSRLVERNFKATEHFRLLRDFYANPDVFIDRVLSA